MPEWVKLVIFVGIWLVNLLLMFNLGKDKAKLETLKSAEQLIDRAKVNGVIQPDRFVKEFIRFLEEI